MKLLIKVSLLCIALICFSSIGHTQKKSNTKAKTSVSSKKKTVKKNEFFTSVNIGAAGLLYFIWYILLFVLLVFFLPIIKTLLLIIVLHFSGIIAFHLSSYFRGIRAHLRILKLSKVEKEALLNTRSHCVEHIQKFVQP